MWLLWIYLAQALTPNTGELPPFQHVVLISVDGLASEALLLDGGVRTPNFQRLKQGPHSLNARCDPSSSVTLPNHVDMLTGRLVDGPLGHHWTINVDPEPDATLHDQHGQILPSLFQPMHQAGIVTAMFASKSKFVLFRNSWNRDGENQIDEVSLLVDPAQQVAQSLAFLRNPKHPRSFLFLHFRGPDDAGHRAGWNLSPGSPYFRAVQEVDKQLGELMDAVAQHPQLQSNTVFVLCADHGGGIPWHNHTGHGLLLSNTRIPLLLWTPQAVPADLYAICANTRLNPGVDPVATQQKLPPIRNADVANLCLALLGLPPLPSATVNPTQDLSAASQKFLRPSLPR